MNTLFVVILMLSVVALVITHLIAYTEGQIKAYKEHGRQLDELRKNLRE